jgi:hypothetical protein
MVRILEDAGLKVGVGAYSIRVLDCEHFVFQEYGGDLGNPSVDADADTVEGMLRDARIVSDALSHAGARHRLAIYDELDELHGYFHCQWPMKEASDF